MIAGHLLDALCYTLPLRSCPMAFISHLNRHSVQYYYTTAPTSIFSPPFRTRLYLPNITNMSLRNQDPDWERRRQAMWAWAKAQPAGPSLVSQCSVLPPTSNSRFKADINYVFRKTRQAKAPRCSSSMESYPGSGSGMSS